MINQLLQSIEESDISGAELIEEATLREEQAWNTHLALFPVAQRVTNPPYINPHWPKAHSVCRELSTYLEPKGLPALVRLEILEFTRKPKLPVLTKPAGRQSTVHFPQIENAIREGKVETTAALLQAFMDQQGQTELARHLLMLGSGYFGTTLGHSVSCTGFILLEMIERKDQDAWPALSALAEYFCKGAFHTTPALRSNSAAIKREELDRQLLAASSGNGIVNLHHTITRYAIERVRHLVSEVEYAHLISGWIDFIGPSNFDETGLEITTTAGDYSTFYHHLAIKEEAQCLAILKGMLDSEKGRQQIGRYLVKGICDLFQGDYDPHFITGLGSALWVVNRYCGQPDIAMNALRQYLNYYLSR